MSSVQDFEWGGEALQLLADGAIYWKRTQTLLIADPHFGKPASFRSAGIPVPAGTTQTDLSRLSTLIKTHAAQRLIVLGDFFHHHTGQNDSTMEQIGAWRRDFSELHVMIVMGNHDRHSMAPPPQWNVQYERHPVMEQPFLFCHEPCNKDGAFVLSGHIHPAIRLYDPIGHSLRLPCFHFAETCALLPAFGSFTGTATIRPQPGDKVFAIAENQVMKIPVRVKAQGIKG